MNVSVRMDGGCMNVSVRMARLLQHMLAFTIPQFLFFKCSM